LSIEHVFAGVAVTRLDPSIAWYERFLGKPPDMRPNDHEATWQLAGAAWVYVVADKSRAGNALLTLLVDDLDEELASLARRGVPAGDVETAPGLFRRTTITDPDGNRIRMGQTLGSRQ
jgi:catechol 2,3-dioxygenase-like lactoylglutathione lyase family enzyme